jgi:hypothetical protein
LSPNQPRQSSHKYKDKQTKKNRNFTDDSGSRKNRLTIFIGWSKRSSSYSSTDDSDEFLKAAIAFGFGEFDATSHGVDVVFEKSKSELHIF